ncbi:MAG: hypothetical protein OXP70_13030 [Acidobacteriota bacterium]|nr:hypothetical protein [Acidobacteriota bacterium]
MRLVFVTPRFGAGDATRPELLAAELARRAPGGWRTTVVTTTAAGESEETFREGEFQDQGVRVVRFPAGDSSGAEAQGPAGAGHLTSPGLLQYLRDRPGDYDLVVLFGASSVCAEAARLDPGRTVLLPFTDEGADTAGGSDIFEHPAAFVFGSEAEEILVLKRYQVHRRMRETVPGTLLLPRTADAAAFRRRTGLTGPYLLAAGPLEPGRGIEELLRFFSTFKDRHADAALELVLIGPAALKIPERPDIRVARPASPRERLDAVGGAVVAVIPERLAAFSTTAAEPFSLGVPILVNASATQLAEECRASGGGLYYQNYDEFELILELGLRDPSLFPRMGAAGREFLESRHDWDSVLARYDRAFRSFARPSRGAAGPLPAVEAVPPLEPPVVPSPADAVEAADPDAAGEELTETAVPPESGELEPAVPEPEAAAESEDETTGEAAAESPEETTEEAPADSAPAEAADEVPDVEAAPETDAAEEAPAAPAEAAGPPEPDGAGEEEDSEPGDDSLPSFFRGSIRD